MAPPDPKRKCFESIVRPLEEGRPLFVVDTETGGFDPRTNGLCSVALKAHGGKAQEHIFVRPNSTLNYSPGAFRVNGLSYEELRDKGVSEREAVRRVLAFLEDNFDEKPEVLGHNVGFDVQFLDALFIRVRLEDFRDHFSRPHNDTLTNMRRLRRLGLVDCPNATLGNSYHYFTGQSPANAHDALGDVLMTEELFDRQVDFARKGFRELE